MNFKLENMLALSFLVATLSLNILPIFGGPAQTVTWHQVFWLEQNRENRVVLTLVVNLKEV